MHWLVSGNGLDIAPDGTNPERAGLIYANAIPVERTSIADLDEKAFDAYFTRRYARSPR